MSKSAPLLDGTSVARMMRLAATDPAISERELDELGRALLEKETQLVVSVLRLPQVVNMMKRLVADTPREIHLIADPTRLRIRENSITTKYRGLRMLFGAILGLMAGLASLIYVIKPGTISLFHNSVNEVVLSNAVHATWFIALFLPLTAALGMAISALFIKKDTVTTLYVINDDGTEVPIQACQATHTTVQQ